MNAYGMQVGGSGMQPVPQNIFATYSSSSATSTSKLLAQQRLASLLYPGEQSLSKFGWAMACVIVISAAVWEPQRNSSVKKRNCASRTGKRHLSLSPPFPS